MATDAHLPDVKDRRNDGGAYSDKSSLVEDNWANRNKVLELLNDLLAAELAWVLRYRRRYFTARGIHSQGIAQEFLDHSIEHQRNADRIVASIARFGAAPDFSHEQVADRQSAECDEDNTLTSMIREDLVFERIAIESYRGAIHYLEDESRTAQALLRGFFWLKKNIRSSRRYNVNRFRSETIR